MTPLELIMLAHRVRLAQKKYYKSRDNMAECRALERQLDDAIEPYVNYAKAIEMQEERNAD